MMEYNGYEAECELTFSNLINAANLTNYTNIVSHIDSN